MRALTCLVIASVAVAGCDEDSGVDAGPSTDAGVDAGTDAGPPSTPVTQLVAVVDTDMMVPDEVAALRVRTLRADADVEEELSSRTIALDADTTLPINVAVEPDDPMAIGRVVLEAEAQNAMGLRVVARRAATEFVEGDQLAVPLFLLESCRRVICPMGSTCGESGRCASEEVPVSELMHFVGELE